MEKQCRSCRWWDHLEEGWGHCVRREVDVGTHEPQVEETLACVYGPQAEDTSLLTHATFGCVEHEEAKRR